MVKEKLADKPTPVKPKMSAMQKIPMIIFAVVFATALMAGMGIIKLPHINPNFLTPTTTTTTNSDEYKELRDGTVGVFDSWQFFGSVTESGQTHGATFTYSLFDPTGEPAPPGLTLHANGILSGTPTKEGTYKFGVCANDGEDEICKGFIITINPKAEPTTTTTIVVCGPQIKCPVTSCDTGNCCCTTKNGIGVYGVITFDCCPRCPNDTHEVNKDVVTPGGPYKICECNKC